MLTLLYFAWIRSRIGLAREQVALPPGITDVAGLIAWLRTRGPGFAEALTHSAVVRVAINHTYVRTDHPIAPGDEVALFPPVTGG
jgi:molybdopterin synthase sulfur carrier subunit